MRRGHTVLLAIALSASLSATQASEDFKLPPEVTPALRAACEHDVRRLCVDEAPSYEKVKHCVEQKFSRLGARCRMALATAGLGR